MLNEVCYYTLLFPGMAGFIITITVIASKSEHIFEESLNMSITYLSLFATIQVFQFSLTSRHTCDAILS